MSALDSAFICATTRNHSRYMLAPEWQVHNGTSLHQPLGLLVSGYGEYGSAELAGAAYTACTAGGPGLDRAVQYAEALAAELPPGMWRTALAPLWVWARSGIACYLESVEADGWVAVASHVARHGLHEVPATAASLSTSPVTCPRTLGVLVSGGTPEVPVYCMGTGITPGNAGGELGAGGAADTALAAAPMRVTSSGVLLLPDGYTRGGVLPCYPDNREYVPDPYDTQFPQPVLVVRALVDELPQVPAGWLVAMLARVLGSVGAEADGEYGEALVLPGSDGELYPLPPALCGV